jgi:hypothetical protein
MRPSSWRRSFLVSAISSKRFRVRLCRGVYDSSCISPILVSSFLRRRLSRNWVSADGVWSDNLIYWALLQLVTTLHRPISCTDSCSQSHCLAAASNGRCSSASGLTSLQGGGHLTPTSYTDRWLHLVLPQLLAHGLYWLTSNCRTPNSAVNSRLASDPN